MRHKNRSKKNPSLNSTHSSQKRKHLLGERVGPCSVFFAQSKWKSISHPWSLALCTMFHLQEHFWSWYVPQSFPGNYTWYSWDFRRNNPVFAQNQICHEGRRLSRWVLCSLRSWWLAQGEDNTIWPFLLGKHSCLQHEHLKKKKAGKRNNL